MGVDIGLPIVVGGGDDYSREAINRGTAITVFEEIRYSLPSSRNSVSLCLKRKHHVPRQDLSKYKWSICTENDLFAKRMLILSYDSLLSDYSSIRFSETETNFRLSGNSRKNLMSF